MPIPYYIANPSPFGGLEEDDPDRRQEGPFDAPPPSVDETKQPKQPTIDPFADNPDDPRVQRLKALDDEIASRPRSLGGIIAGFSPHGDRTMVNLMAQRHLAGQEYHGDQQIRRQLASSQMLQESAFRRADALEKAARERAAGTQYGADQRLAGTQYSTDGRLAGTMYGADKRLEGTQYGADKRLEGTEYRTDNQKFRPQADRNAPAAGKAPANPQIPVLQAELKQLAKAINDPNITDDQKLPLMRKYNLRRQQLEQMTGQSASAPSAAPSTAPGVKASGTAQDNDPLGIR